MLPLSGQISALDINTELEIGETESGLDTPSLRALAGIASGAIAYSDFYGHSKIGGGSGGGGSGGSGGFCTLPWGGTVADGTSTTAYQTSSVPYGISPTSEQRVCTNGVLSGSYTFASCTVEQAPITFVDQGIRGYSMSGYRSTFSRGNLTQYDLFLINGVNFADNTSFNLSATVVEARCYLQGVCSADKGYAMGGTSISGSTAQYSIEALSFADETNQQTSAQLLDSREDYAGVYSQTVGYTLGGFANIDSNSIEGLRFADESNVSVLAVLDSVISQSTPTGVSSLTKGYVLGGNDDGSSTIQCLQFPNETVVLAASALDSLVADAVGFNSQSYGYVAGGFDVNGSGSATSMVQSLKFTDETVATESATLSMERSDPASTNSRATGYVMGGTNDMNDSYETTRYIDAFDFVTGTMGRLGSLLSQKVSASAGVQRGCQPVDASPVEYGGGSGGGAAVCQLPWGGTTPNGSSVTAYQTATVPYGATPVSETRVCSKGVLSGSYAYSSCAVDSPVPTVLPPIPENPSLSSVLGKGYQIQGSTSAGRDSGSTSILFSTEVTGSVSNTFATPVIYSSGVSSLDNGYSIAGTNSSIGVTNSVDKLSFSTESATRTSVQVSISHDSSCGMQSAASGYDACGTNIASYLNQVWKIQFSTDTGSSCSSTLPDACMLVAGLSSQQFGYVVGGMGNYPNSFNVSTNINRLSFSDDTAASISAKLSSRRSFSSGTYSLDNGYVAGGSDGFYALSSIEKLSFTTETTSNSSAVLSCPRQNSSGVSSSARGYYLGGLDSTGAGTALSSGVEFSTDSSFPVSMSILNSRMASAGVQSHSNQYGGGSGTSCSLPWGGTIADGMAVTAYQTATVPYGSIPAAESRVCSSGVLSGSYTNQSCTIEPAPSACVLPWGGTTADGTSVTSYKDATVPYGTTPVSEQRTCSNGVLSGSYTNQSCTVDAPAVCALPWGGTIADGASVTAYDYNTGTHYNPITGSPPAPPGAIVTTLYCWHEQRTCQNGVLSGSFTYPSCTNYTNPV